MLAFVVLNVATSSSHPDNSFYGLAIGLTVLSGAVAVGSTSGGVFNPAVAVGVSAQGLISWSLFWIYIVSNLTGGALAGAVFRLLNADDVEPIPPQAQELAVPARTNSTLLTTE